METINNEPKVTKQPKAEEKQPVKRRRKTITEPKEVGKSKEIRTFEEPKEDRYEKVRDNFGRIKFMDSRSRKKRMVHPDMVDEVKRKWDSALVTGVFKYYELRGGKFTFWDRLPYVGEKMRRFDLQDGHTATIPRHTARKLREGGKYPIHKDIYDEHGKHSQQVGEWVDRFDFFETNTVIEPMTPKIVTVQNV